MRIIITALAVIASYCTVAAADFSDLFKNGIPTAPSFTYANKPFSIKDWKIETQELSNTAEAIVKNRTYTSPDNILRVSQKITSYKKFDIVEWSVRIENIGDVRSQIVENFDVLKLHLNNPRKPAKSEGVNIRRYKGSDTSITDFTRSDFFLERGNRGKSMSMRNEIGYSSSEWLPYMGIDFDLLNGLNIAIGWSGNWKANFSIGDSGFFANIGTLKTRFYLDPKESIIQPSMLVMKRKNMSIEDARNVWRKFMLEHKTPRENGKPFVTPIVTSTGGNVPDEVFFKCAENVKKHSLPFGLLGVDAGWYGGDHTPEKKDSFGDWVKRAGDWRMNKNVHPEGLGKISQAARDANLKFSLWLEIERVMPSAPLYSEHPELMTKTKDGGKDRAALNLGNERAWKYAFETLCKTIEENGVDIWRIDSDYHVDFASAWRTLDSQNPDRVGIGEAKHVEGFYKLWDELKKRYPKMQFDNCASGGKRLDFESMSRTFSVWRSDAQCTAAPIIAESNQIQNYYLHEWLPSHCGGSGSALEDEYGYVSSMSTGITISAGRVAKDENIPQIKRLLKIANRVRDYISKDFYQLTENPERLENWCAYQACDKKTNSGFIAVFRRENSPNDWQRLSPRGIDKNATYKLEDLNGKVLEISGSDLADLKVELPKRSSQIYFYSKTENKRKE